MDERDILSLSELKAQMKTKERELEERFEQRTRHLEALESSVVEKLKLSEYHADALHSGQSQELIHSAQTIVLLLMSAIVIVINYSYRWKLS